MYIQEMKRSILLLLILIAISGYGQLDSLQKYSYQLLGFSINNKTITPVGGSGFFIRNNDRLFFLTANHVISGCRNIPNFPGEMKIVIKDIERDNYTLQPIAIKNALKSIPCDSINNIPDYNLFEIDDYNNNNILSIEKFLLPPFKEVSQVQFHGFPSVATNPGSVFIPVSSLYYNISVGQITTPIYYDIVQDFNYLISVENLADSIDGFSGSPVFLKDKKSDKKRVVGLLSASVMEGGVKYLTVCRIDPIIKHLNELIFNR